MNGEKIPDSLPLFKKGEEDSPPSEESVLRHLAQTLSVTKTLKRFPSLTAKDLQQIFLHSADRVKENRQDPATGPPQKEFPELFIHADGASRGNPGEAGAGAVISDSRGRTLKELK